MPDAFPPIGVQAVIAGMAAFNRDAAIVEGRLLAINRVTNQLERDTGGAFGGLGTAFSAYATTVSTGATLIGGALALAGGVSIKFAADFQQSLALTKALTGATSDEMTQLSGVITDLSRHGIIGMNDLAEAATELARSGVPIQSVMGGALKGVQDLTEASGGEIGLQAAAKLVATSMNAFNLSVDDTARITTAATVVAQNSALTFTDFGTAVQYAGAPAHALGFTIEDLATGFALLGKNGLTGSVAATALRNIFLRLQKPSKDAAEVMKEYGINLYDASGNARPFRDLIEQLNNAFGDQAVAQGKLTEQQRDHAISTLFLTRAANAALILTKEGTEGFDAMRASFANLKAEDLVGVVLEPLNAQLKIAANNVVALAIAFGSQFLPPLQDAASSIVKFLQSISTNAMVDFGQLIISIGKAIVGFGLAAVQTFTDFLQAFGLTNAAADVLKSTLVGLGVTIAAVLGPPVLGAVAGFAAMTLAIGAVTLAASHLDDGVKQVGYQFAKWVSQFGPLGQGIGNLVRSISDAFGALGALFRGDFDTAIHQANISFFEFAATLRMNGGEALQFLQDHLAEAGAALAPWAAQAGTAGKVVSDALSGVSGVVLTLQYLLQGNLVAAGQAAQIAMDNFAKALGPVADALGGEVRAALDWLGNVGLPAVKTAFETVLNFIATKVVPQLGIIADTINTTVRAALDWLTNTGWPEIQKAAEAVIAYIESTAIPTLNNLASTVSGTVQPAFDTLANTTLPATGSALGAFFSQLGSATQDLFSFGHTVFDLLNPLRDLQEAWNNLNATGTFLHAALTNLGIAFGQILSPIGQLTQPLRDLIQEHLGLIAAVVSFGPVAIGFITVTKAITVAIDAITAILRQSAEDLAAWSATFVAQTQAAGQAMSDFGATMNAIGGAVSEAIAAMVAAVVGYLQSLPAQAQQVMADFSSSIIGALAALGPAAGASAAGIGAAIIAGLIGGILARASEVAAAAANVVQGAIDAAKAKLSISSPSRVFYDIGEDTTQGFTDALDDGQSDAEASGSYLGLSAADGLITALDASKAPVRASASGLVDQLINEFNRIETQAEQALQNTGDKMAKVGEDVGRKINQAIQDAANQIEKVQQDAASRIQDLQDSLAQSRSDQGRRTALQRDQDAARQARKDSQEDADAAAAHQKDIDDAAFKHKQDLDKAAAKQAQDLSQATTQKQKDAVANAYSDAVAAADENYKLNLDTIDKNFAASEKDRLAKRQRAKEDADFEANLAKQTQDLNDQLENEALQRNIQRAEKDRDARIDAINQALQTKEDKLKADAQAELDQLNQNITKKLAALQNDFANKAADILRKGGEQMQPLIDSIQEALTNNFGIMTGAAQGFVDTINNAIGALNHLNSISSHVSIPAPGHGTNGGEAAPPASGAGGPTQGAAPGVDPTLPGGGAGGGAGLHVFGNGGIVPGPYGKPMLAIVHGGEFITALGSEASRIARAASQYQPQINRTYNYNVNASYANTQSEASVEMDMRSLVMLSRA